MKISVIAHPNAKRQRVEEDLPEMKRFEILGV